MDEKKPPKADVLAGKGSFAGKIKQRREALDAGDPSGGQAKELKETVDTVKQGYSVVLKED